MAISRILVALDASERARAVLDGALGIAAMSGGRLVLLRVVTVPVEFRAEALSLPPDKIEDVLYQRAQKDLGELAALAPPGVVEKRLVLVGTPWEQICQAAKSEAADLVVIGSHGYRLIDRVVGTTAARVVNRTDRSVLVVRPPA